MHKYFTIVLISTSILTTHASQASERMSLDQLLAEKDPVKKLEELKTQSPENFKSLCADINEPNTFYPKAKLANVGTIKQTQIINKCVGATFEQGTFKPVIQKPKQAEAKPEAVQLKPVDFGKKTANIQEEQKTLQAAKKIILENAALLGKKQEVEAKLLAVEEELKKAQDFYDNLSVAVAGIREDLDTFTRFRYFNPKEHSNDTPEKYLETLDAALQKGDRLMLPKVYIEQLNAANNLLKQANENLATARLDLERINREMLVMTK